MSIKANPDGRSATVRKDGVTGAKSDGRGTPRRTPPMAMPYAKGTKFPPTTMKPVPARKKV